MSSYSILNDVLGPVMHGPSSSHTAASWRIAVLARSLLGNSVKSARFTFDPAGSYGAVFRDQGSDLAFASGVMGWDITDDRFFDALTIAAREGVEIEFEVGRLPGDDHPNAVRVEMTGADDRSLEAMARSTGGGSVELTKLDGWPVSLKGDAHCCFIRFDPKAQGDLFRELDRLNRSCRGSTKTCASMRTDEKLLQVVFSALPPEGLETLRSLPGVREVRCAPPLLFPRAGEPAFGSGHEVLEWVSIGSRPLAEAGLTYEAQLLGLSEERVRREMEHRLIIMENAVRQGSAETSRLRRMRLLNPTAGKVLRAESEGRLFLGGPAARAAARAMAAMHVNSSMGLVCAAPTGGSSGVIPGVLVTLDEMGVDLDRRIDALLAAGTVGLIFLLEGKTFAAEVAGCQVEIGAAGAMAAAAVVQAAGGTGAQALDAAAIALQNTMGWPCDLVQGVVEIPCHTRNAVAASSAFICADLILGSYENPIPLDETVAASLAVGKALPSELRCTAKGGLATTPSARSMKKRSTSSQP